MKVEELMIGDWIIGPDLEPKRVVAILNFDEIKVEEEQDSDKWITYNVGDTEPIPILPWMLERNGFRYYKPNEIDYWGKDLWIQKNKEGAIIKVWKSAEKWFIQYYSKDGYTNISMPLQTNMVHELQHLLKYCNVEQEITIQNKE